MIQSSMGAHILDVRYGDRNTLPYYNGILLSTLLSDADVVIAITAGSVYSVTTGGFLVPGMLPTAGATSGNMPYYGWSGLDANNYPDVQRTAGMPGFFDNPVPAPGGYPAGTNGFPFQGVPISAGLVGGFVTVGPGFRGELSTTEFNTAASYPIGAPLTCVSNASSSAADKQLRGKLRPLAAGTDTIIGFVAPAAKYLSPMGYNTLAFYPNFVQGTTLPANYA